MRIVKIAGAASAAIALLMLYQNCSEFKGAGASAGSAAVTQSSVTCSQSALKGDWAADPQNPGNLASEFLTIDDNCAAQSRMCGSRVQVPAMAAHNGTPIQGSTRLTVTGSGAGANCLPNGNYDCSFSFGPTSDGDVFAANCGGGIELAFYRVPAEPAVTSSAAKFIYVTNNDYPSVFTVAQADGFCMSDSGRPSSVAVAKAMIAHSVNRVACTSPNCASGIAGRVDWVFNASTEYRRPDGLSVGTTNALAILSSDGVGLLPNSAGNIAKETWSGFQVNSDWTVSNTNCQNWSTTFTSPTTIGRTDRTSRNLSLLQSGCDRRRSFVCVEQ